MPELLRVALATALASIGLAAGGTGGALLASQIAGDPSVAGLPFAAVVVGSAAGALLIGRLSSRLGRGRSLAIGYLVGVVGAAIVIGAAAGGSLPLLLAGSVLLGPANASVFMARYAGADLVGPSGRGRGLGIVLFAAAVGAVVAPNLLGPSAIVAERIGLTPHAGLYLVAVIAFGVGAAMLAARGTPSTRVAPAEAPRSRRSLLGLVVLGAANLTMVGIMAIAPVHLTAHGHDLSFVGVVISLHVAGMLGLSPMTGWLSDRIGPAWLAVGGAALLATAGVWGAAAEPTSAGHTAGFLFVLGLGWNLAVVAGSAMLTADLRPHDRPRAEAAGEVGMSLAAAVGASGAGLLASAAGWAPMMLAAASAGSLVVLGGLAGRWASRARATAAQGDRLGAWVLEPGTGRAMTGPLGIRSRASGPPAPSLSRRPRRRCCPDECGRDERRAP